MARVKRGVMARKRHKKILKLAKGYYGARSRVFRVAKQAVIKASNSILRWKDASLLWSSPRKRRSNQQGTAGLLIMFIN